MAIFGKSRRFRNPDGSAAPGTVVPAFRMLVVDSLAGRGRGVPRKAAVPCVAPDLAAIATPPGVGEGARLTWIGHASWLVQLEGKSFLIDPVFGELALGPGGRNVPAGLQPENLPPIDAVLISHNHYDHLDLPSVRSVGAPVIAGLGMTSFLAKKGISASELDWWQSVDLGPVRVTFVPAQHYSRRGLTDINETLWGGFIVEGDSVCIYHSGDTGYFDGFREIGHRFPAIDAALLPIGAYEPSWFMRRQHMNPEEAVQAYMELGAGDFFAMHWGTFKLTYEPLDEPPVRLAAEWKRLGLPRAEMRVLAVGETANVWRFQND
ncbi:MBL fold metallo-hydrolase [Stenotrophomonas maltophilia]|uniref:MBL fold metallo-hydrolase n=1 Tax=Stenotrophomonas maltophilia TaxID=40324 RepID=UPI002893D4AB|nr:MBL fold metallo-hydrolase [Stenotrophomonas maltophilia]MDT3430807.1 MBL fold metallo-hydrolase [Stenotrophomonas maltophilia]